MSAVRELKERRSALLAERRDIEGRLENQLDDAKEVYDLIFHKKFRQGGEWIERTKRRGRRDKLVINLLGGVRHLWAYLHPERHVQSAADRRGPNSSIQGTASNLGFIGGYFARKLAWELYESRDVALGYIQCNAVHDCVVGSTLVPTTRGLIRIDQMAAGNSCSRRIDYDVASRFSDTERAARWTSRGVRPTLRVETSLGNEVQGTEKHELLVLRNGFTDWVRIGDVRVGDRLCVNLESTTRISKLGLSLGDHRSPDWVPNQCVDARPRTDEWLAVALKDTIKPTCMSPSLAFFMALLISEGILRQRSLRITNSSERLLIRAAECIEEVFGVSASVRQSKRESPSGADHFVLTLNSIQVCEWLEELGVYGGKTEKGKSPSYRKVVPWSILQADRESQMAFVAGYLEGDGNVGPNGFQLSSVSRTLVMQMQSMLLSHGCLAVVRSKRLRGYGIERRDPNRRYYRLNVGAKFAVAFLSEASRYFVDRVPTPSGQRRYDHGVPMKWWKRLIDSRCTATRGKSVYRTDDGNEVTSPLAGAVNWRRNKTMLYDEYAVGTHDAFMRGLLMISKSAHARLVSLMDRDYVYPEVTRVCSGGRREVYDLSIARGGEPAYVANGLVCHNSTEAECPPVNVPIVDYLCTHAYSTMLHRWMRDVVGFETPISFEMDSAIGATLAEMHDATRWDQQLDAIRKALEWKRDNLGLRQPIDEIMSLTGRNAEIVFDVRRREIHRQLERNRRVSYDMDVNRDNALTLGLTFKMPRAEVKKVERREDAWRRELRE